MQILRKELGEARQWRRDCKKWWKEGKKGGNCRHKAQVKPGYEWGTYRRQKYLAIEWDIEKVFFVHSTRPLKSTHSDSNQACHNFSRKKAKWNRLQRAAAAKLINLWCLGWYSPCSYYATLFLSEYKLFEGGPTSPLRFELFICKAVKIWVIEMIKTSD